MSVFGNCSVQQHGFLGESRFLLLFPPLFKKYLSLIIIEKIL